MAEAYLGEIRMVGFNFAPMGWALCNGQLLPISSNTPLFALLGTTFGGNGQTTFALPDLRGRVPVHQGQGPGLSPYVMGEAVGAETVTLINSNMPLHNHALNVNNQPGPQTDPTNALISVVNDGSGRNPTVYPAYSTSNPTGAMSAQAVGLAGGNMPHENRQPSLTVNFIICLQGIFPARQ